MSKSYMQLDCQRKGHGDFASLRTRGSGQDPVARTNSKLAFARHARAAGRLVSSGTRRPLDCCMTPLGLSQLIEASGATV